MRVPKQYVVSSLIIICMVLSTGYTQTSKPLAEAEVNGSQHPGPKPSNPGENTATRTVPDAENSSKQAAPGMPTRLGAAQPATSATQATTVQNSPLGTASPQSQAAIPQNVLFEFLFNNISALNQVADSNDKGGNHATAALWRTHDQRGAGLNDAEGQILQEITLDCLRMLKEQDAKFRAAAEKFRAQLKPGAPVQIPAELVQMGQNREKIVSDHIERLREALGDASFKKLDTYVHSSFHAQVIEAKPTPPSTGGEPKESK